MYQPQSGSSARSPPPLHHPIPTHPKVSVPEPPVSPGYAPGARGSAGPYAGGHPAAYAGGPGAAPRASVSQMNPGYQRINSPTYTSAADPYSYGADASARGAPGVGMQSMGSMYAAQGGVYDDAAAPGYGGPGFPPGYGTAGGMASPNGLPHMGSRGAGAGAESQWGAGGMPFAAGGMMNDATAQMGVQFGRHVAQVGGEYMQRNLGALLPMPILKHYFNVSNSYVLHKLRILLFPWRHRPWSRKMRYSTPYGSGAMSPSRQSTPTPYRMATPEGMISRADAKAYAAAGDQVSYCPPREDVNSPDMYIPYMAFVTYVIISSVIYGLRGRFHPEILGYTASRALAIVLIELSAMKLGCYLLNIQGDHTIVDLLAYSGYKFVGTILVLCVGMLGWSRWLYWIAFLYVFAANAFFLLRSLRYVVLPDPAMTSSVTVTHSQRTSRIQFLFGIAVAQIVFGWLLIAGVF